MPLSAFAASGVPTAIRKISGSRRFPAGMTPRAISGIFVSGICCVRTMAAWPQGPRRR
jgi:hypothetical protein